MMSFEQVLSADRPTLAQQWESLFKRPPPPNIQIALIRRILSWHAQAHATRRKSSHSIFTLEPVLKPSRPAPLLSPGTRLLREWKGATHEVLVLPHGQGFQYQGATFTSLTKIATTITGTPWSGPAFFGVKR